MPFSRPTLTRLISRVRGDVEGLLQNGASMIRRSLENAMSVAVGGLSHTLHGHIEYGVKQLFPDTADDEFLVRWAAIWGLDRNAAEAAELEITVTGTVGGTVIPEGTRWVRADGVVFESTAEFELPASAPYEVTVTVVAEEGGADGNTIPGTELNLESPIAGVEAAATVDGAGDDAIGGGADQETIEQLRVRLLEQIQTPPKGGAEGDYVAWAKEVSGVTRAWELPGQLGPGTVLLLFVMDDFDDDGFFVSTTFPGAGEISDVEDYVADVKPITVEFTADAPINVELDPTIQLSPNTADVRTAVERELEDLILREAAPGGTLLLSQINEAISLAVGEEDHVLVSPAADVTVAATELLTLGTITFQEIP